VKYANGRDFRKALEYRIEQAANKQDSERVRWRKQVAFERLLARLLHVAPDRWIVKGGFALNLRFGDVARTTRDMDLAYRDALPRARDDLLQATETDFDDYFNFEIVKSRNHQFENDDHPGDLDHHRGIEFEVRSSLGNRLWETLRVDVGRAADESVLISQLQSPGFMTFAGIEPIQVPVISLELQIAEKVHAASRRYREGEESSRPKDLIDIVLISSECPVDAERLRSALEATFKARATHALPGYLSPPPANWRTAYRDLAISVALDPDLDTGHRRAARFLDPVLAGDIDSEAVWDPASAQWRPPT
jgi:predicted nucleotidyltransferase component of viral defense system